MSFRGVNIRRKYGTVQPPSDAAFVRGDAQRAVPAEIEVVRQTLAEKSLLHFTRQAWPIIEPQHRFIEGRHIGGICEHLEAVTSGQIKQLLINVPPGMMKSLLTGVLWPTWEWCRNPEPPKVPDGQAFVPASSRWLFASYDARLSTRDSLKRRQIFDSPWYQKRWGQHWKWLPDQNEKTKYQNDATGWMFSTSVAGGGTGEHPNRIVIDDPLNVEQSYSDEFRERANRWFDGTIGSRGVMIDAACVVVMQRLHDRDLSGHILAEKYGFEHICLPMWYEPDRMKPTSIGWTDWRTTEGELLWPAGYSEEKARKLERRLGVMQAPGQLQQRPTKKGGVIFTRTQFKYFRVETLAALDNLNEFDSMLRHGHPMAGKVFVLNDANGRERRYFPWDCWWFQTCDTASSEEETAAYTVVTTVAVTPDNNILVFDVVRDRIEFNKQFNFLREHRRRFSWIEKQCVEKASTGIALISLGKAEGLPFSVLEAIGTKETRAGAIATFYENGQVYHLDRATWLDDFETELISFPRGEFKDQVDTMSYVGLEVVIRRGCEPRIRDVTKEEVENSPSIEDLMGLTRYLGGEG